jgi:predicted NAD-dependent protein-ADP-ribosyltransferase YbiA (DUF1768 family)
MSDCTIGKDFNPKSCRWIKGCRNGYSRNENFKCVRSSDNRKKKVGKEALDLVKELFSNENNGLVNSISPQRSRSKRLTKSQINAFNEFNSGLRLNRSSKGSKGSKYSELKQRIKQFIENIGENIVNIESDVFEMAKEKGIRIKNPREKYLFRKMLMEYISSIKSKSKKKKGKSRGKSVKFAKTPNPSEPGPSEPANTSLNQSRTRSKSRTKPGSKPKISKTKRSVSKTNEIPKTSKTPKTPNITITNEDREKEEKIIVFLNKLGIKTLQELTIKIVTQKYSSEGIELGTKEDRDIFREYVHEFIESYTSMNRERALNALELRKDYTLSDLQSQYRNRSRDIVSNTNLNVEEKGIEYDRLDKAYSRLKEKFERNVTKDGTDGTVFMFYSKSRDVKPGMGAGEQISKENVEKYEPLSRIKDWRKKLSNFWIQPFKIDGKQWQSVEHYYQASKFKGTPEFFNQFSLDSGSDLSKDPLLAKAAGGKTGKLGKQQIRPKEIVIDTDFFEGKHKEEMYRGQFAKFTQNLELLDTLLQTKDAQLVHYTRGGKPVVFTGLMLIRQRNQ